MAKDTSQPTNGNRANLGFETSLGNTVKGAPCDWPN
jgi:hypothetical protein